MEEQIQKLKNLIEFLPLTYSARTYSQLNMVFSRYSAILDYLNSYNEDLKRTTSIYYTDISTIRDIIYDTLYCSTEKEKHSAFCQARKELETDINALTTLIQPQMQIESI